MEILPDMEIIDLGLYLHSCNALVISDLQLGYEEALNRKGILVPRFQFKDIIDRLEKMFKMLKERQLPLELFIIDGDLKHNFGSITNQEWREILKLFDFVKKHCKRLIVVKGNHDMVLAPVIRKRDVELVDELILGDILFLHGHELPATVDKKVKTIVIGHEHPALTLREGYSREQFKCFLKGKWKKYNLIVLPSFNPLIPGSDVLSEKQLSPFLKNVRKFEAFIVEDKVYYFGKIGKLM